MAIREILLLGNPLLTKKCEDVLEGELADAIEIGKDLHDTMSSFRAKHGWGRAIAAPQIGVMKRIVYMNVDSPWLIINPVISSPSNDMMELWDDCMSFPDLLVRLKRHCSFNMTYRDENWKQQEIQVEGLLSELLQHEIDHLDGVLAVSRAIDGSAFGLQSQRHLLSGGMFANKVANLG